MLRFNFRGVGASEGSFDEGRGEREDLGAMIDHLALEHEELVVAGFSFGAWVGLDVGARDPRVGRLVGLGLPVNVYDAGFLRGVAKPMLLVHGDRDPFGDLDRVRAVVADAGERARLVTVEGADHVFTGRLEAMMEAVTSFARGPRGGEAGVGALGRASQVAGAGIPGRSRLPSLVAGAALPGCWSGPPRSLERPSQVAAGPLLIATTPVPGCCGPPPGRYTPPPWSLSRSAARAQLTPSSPSSSTPCALRP